ncbi:hypothetical protein [Ruminococcus albus]|uniref:Uncharacterized protein n=1 Tax=Ruminococcus albus TaxID=1264 RepID=A0A1I1IN53_RUMAL|nr:hypothetical protein [Ruminococcus albus]SFC35183.1 hypothetical protein SAMN02910406_01577 [Ruminococcus albus]
MKNTMFRKIIAVLAALIGIGSLIAFVFMNMGDSTIAPAIVLMGLMLVLRVGFNKLNGR